MLDKDIGYSNSKGKVIIDRNILLSVINLAVKEVSGVASMSENFGSKLKKSSKSSKYDGIRINFLKDGLEIYIYINIFSNYQVPAVSYKIQESVKNGVASLIDVTIKKINVNVINTIIKDAV